METLGWPPSKSQIPGIDLRKTKEGLGIEFSVPGDLALCFRCLGSKVFSLESTEITHLLRINKRRKYLRAGAIPWGSSSWQHDWGRASGNQYTE